MRKAATGILRKTPLRTKRCLSDRGRAIVPAAGLYAGLLRGFLNFARADAGRTHAQPLGSAVDHRVDRLQIQIPAALADIMGVADAVAKPRTAAAYITHLCHVTGISSRLRN